MSLPLLPVHPDYVAEVGRLCAAWSYLEVLTDRIVWGMLGVNERIGSFITAPKDLSNRWQFIVDNGGDVFTPEECKVLKKISRLVVGVSSDRNIVVHGQILYKQPITYAVVTRGAPAGKFHPVSKAAVEIILQNIKSLCEASHKIAKSHNWLQEPKEGEIVSGWPKPIEEFPEPLSSHPITSY